MIANCNCMIRAPGAAYWMPATAKFFEPKGLKIFAEGYEVRMLSSDQITEELKSTGTVMVDWSEGDA